VSFHATQEALGSRARVKNGLFVARAVLTAAVLMGATGCTATFTPEPVVVAYDAPVAAAEVVPYDIYAYPRVYYGGTYVYLVNGRWYFPSARGWMVYRQEPHELRRYRAEIHRAPERRQSPPVAPPREYGRERRPR
jgi:hypothetical protein